MAETLRVKIARALRGDKNLTCSALAKMFGTRTGSVCGTPEWREHMDAKRKAGEVPMRKPGKQPGVPPKTASKSKVKSVGRPKVLALLDKVSAQIADLDRSVAKRIADLDRKISSLL